MESIYAHNVVLSRIENDTGPVVFYQPDEDESRISVLMLDVPIGEKPPDKISVTINEHEE